jgi:hypothetical protein
MINSFNTSTNIKNSTFVRNAAQNTGGAISNSYAATPTILNFIFWDNTITGNNNVAGADIKNDQPSTAISYSITQQNSVHSSGNNIFNNQNPLFVDALNGVLSLTCTSPAINKGTLTGAPTDDMVGFTRTGNPDLGAYEYDPSQKSILTLNNEIADGTNPIVNTIPVIKASGQILNTNNVLYQGSNNVQLFQASQ